jgi:hypothetical protein
MRRNARIPATKPLYYRRNQARDDGFITSNRNLAKRRVTKKFNILHSLTQIIENGCCAMEQRTTIGRRFDAMKAAIKQTHAKNMFQIGDGPRNCGLRRIEPLRSLAHATRLNHRHQDV